MLYGFKGGRKYDHVDPRGTLPPCSQAEMAKERHEAGVRPVEGGVRDQRAVNRLREGVTHANLKRMTEPNSTRRQKGKRAGGKARGRGLVVEEAHSLKSPCTCKSRAKSRLIHRNSRRAGQEPGVRKSLAEAEARTCPSEKAALVQTGCRPMR